MTAPLQVVCNEVPPQAWRNGGGVTRELLAWPPGDGWQVRISVADIDRDGPFSAFAGVARWFAVLAGAGVELGLPDGPAQLRVGDAPCVFDGADAPTCRLLGGPTRDLNLMLRHADGGMYRAEDGAAWQPGAGQCGLFAPVNGAVQVESGDGSSAVMAVPAMSLSWWAAAPARLVFHAQAAAVDASPASAQGWWLAARPRAG